MNKVAIITGASSGIGRSLALRGAELGYNLALFARNNDALLSLKNEIAQFSDCEVLLVKGPRRAS